MTLEGAKRNIKCVTRQLNRPLTKPEKDAFTIAYNCIDERRQLYHFKTEIAEMGDATIDAKEVLKILDKYLSRRKDESKK